MILAFELMWTGVTHAPINSAMIQIISAALPGHALRVHADPSHLEELRRGAPGVELVPIAPPTMHGAQTQIVSWARFRGELAIIRAALRAAPRNERCLIVMLSATPTAIWAAALAARLHGRTDGVHVALHGNLNDAIGWRSRNPLARGFDLAATLQARLPAPVRFIVFEHAIREALAARFARAAARTDVVPHPVNPGDLPIGYEPQPALGDPIRIGFVGQGTRAKGFDAFLGVARALTATHGARVAFHAIGSVRPELTRDAAATPLAEPTDWRALSREDFTTRLARLDYVMLPFRHGYYDLSASGGLIDAVTWLKPVITTRVPLTEGFFAAYGDIGALAPCVADLAGITDAIVRERDDARHAAQVAALRRARQDRTPAALAPGYRAAVAAGFPTFAPEGPA